MTSEPSNRESHGPWTWANFVTFLRLILAFPIVWLIIGDSSPIRWPAFFLLAIAASTDGLDGYLARSRGEISDLGRLLDPVADKVMGIGVFAALVYVGLLPTWLLWTLLIKELVLLIGGAVLLGAEGRVVSARPLGKWATVILFCGFLALLLGIHRLGLWTTYVAVFLSLAAGVDYALLAISHRAEHR